MMNCFQFQLAPLHLAEDLEVESPAEGTEETAAEVMEAAAAEEGTEEAVAEVTEEVEAGAVDLAEAATEVRKPSSSPPPKPSRISRRGGRSKSVSQ
jgi:hypothetical protein